MTQLTWSVPVLLILVNLVKREEIMYLIMNESVDLVPLGSYLSKLLDPFCNETKYVKFLDQFWHQQIT